MVTIRATIFGLLLAAGLALLPAAPAAPRDAGTPPPTLAPASSPADRDGDRIFDDLEGRLAKSAPGDRLRVIVSLASPATRARVSSLEQVVGNLSVTHRFTVVAGFAATVEPDQVEGLARLASVVHVEEDIPVRTFNDTAQESFGVAKARQDAPGLDGNLDGDVDTYSAGDLVAAVVDTGIDAGHADLDEGKVLAFVNCAGQPCTAQAAIDDNGHGTHVAATIAGDGDGRPDQQYRGVAPAAGLVGVKVLDAMGSGNASDIVVGIDWVVQNRVAFGIEAINLSVGQSGCDKSGGTDAASQAVNAAHAAGLVVSVAAGNSGPGACTVGTPAGAAGALTVGAMADLEAVNSAGWAGPGFYQAAFSSRGPTFDGRTKPDISAPGVGITSAMAGTTNDYTVFGGTSMATPFVAGVALLMLDANPVLTSQDVKEKIMETAVDWGPSGPDNDYGAGRLDAYAAIDAADSTFALGTPPAAPPHVLLEGNLAGTGAEVEYLLEVPSLEFPLAATLITPGWAGGSPDVDLELFAPDGTLIGSGETNLRQDQLGVLPTTTGTYLLRIRSFSGAGAFFVDVSGAVPTVPAPSLRHSLVTVDEAIGLGGDGDGVLEPGEAFTLLEQLMNRGGAAATGVSGTLSALGGSGATLTQAVSPYGDIAAGAIATNATPFAGSLAPDAPCGRPMQLSLALTSDQGPMTVPVAVPTGASGQPVSRSAVTDQAIPDQGFVVSTLEVPTLGLLKDVDVVLSEVRHTWDGDLSFELTSPAGTTVLLVNRRGSNGNDFLDTVLDDEAGTKIFAGRAPFTGRFRPDKPLSMFDGEQQQGLWTLKVTDHGPDDVGTLKRWGTEVSKAVCTSVSIDDATVVEGDGGTTTATFTVELDRASATTVNVDYAAADGTAVKPDDYIATSGTLSFAPGQTEQTVTVPVAGDELDESDEQLEVRLENFVDALAGDVVGVGTIVDDDYSPVAQAQGVSTDEDAPKAITLSATDGDSPSLSYTIIGDPSDGTLSGTAPDLIYTPAANYNGTDSFTFRASDGANDSNTATVTITVNPVNDAPLANDGTASVDEDGGPAAIDLGALASDVETPDADASYEIVSGPSKGSLSPMGAVRSYTPNADANGSDTFTYRVTDRGDPDNCGPPSTGCDVAETSATKQVTITINPLNDAPAAVDDAAATARNTAKDIDVVVNDTDVELDTLTVTAVTNPLHGTAAINPDGTVLYTPDSGYVGSDSFEYTIGDGNGGTDTATVNVTVTAGTAPVAANDSYTVAENGSLSVPAPGVLGNDTDADSDTLTALLVSGAPTLNADGSFEYTPPADLNGPVTFTYRADDGVLSSDVATVTITVTPDNDKPLANDGTASVNEDGGPVAIDLGSLVSDGETADANLTYELVGGPLNGTLSPTGAVRNYTPNANFNGTDAFTYRVTDRGDPDDCGAPGAGCDGPEISLTKQVEITVNPVNDPPVLDASGNPTLTAINEDATNPAGNTVAAILATGAGGDPISDVDAGALEGIAVVATGASGSWEYSLDGGTNWNAVGTSEADARLLGPANKLRFVPNAGFHGSSTIAFRAWDQTSGTAGTKVDTSVNGGTTAFSTAIETTSITVAQAQPPPPPPPPPFPPLPPPPAPPQPRTPKAGVASGRIVVTASGVAPVRVSCVQGACRGSITLEATLNPGLASAEATAKKLILGRRSFTLKAGQRKAISVKLRGAGLKLLRQRGKLRARAILTIRGGKRSTRTVTLVAARRR